MIDLSAAGIDAIINMRKWGRAEALPIFYWARQYRPARLMKWRKEARVREVRSWSWRRRGGGVDLSDYILDSGSGSQ